MTQTNNMTKGRRKIEEKESENQKNVLNSLAMENPFLGGPECRWMFPTRVSFP
jgi:hypothetical protein